MANILSKIFSGIAGTPTDGSHVVAWDGQARFRGDVRSCMAFASENAEHSPEVLTVARFQELTERRSNRPTVAKPKVEQPTNLDVSGLAEAIRILNEGGQHLYSDVLRKANANEPLTPRQAEWLIDQARKASAPKVVWDGATWVVKDGGQEIFSGDYTNTVEHARNLAVTEGKTFEVAKKTEPAS